MYEEYFRKLQNLGCNKGEMVNNKEVCDFKYCKTGGKNEKGVYKYFNSTGNAEV